MFKGTAVKRHLILLLVLLVAVLGLQVACSPGLPEDEKRVLFNLGHFDGRSWGQAAASGNWKVYWVSPDRVQEFHQDFYIPKGYLPIEHFANAHFPDVTPYSEKQKKEACEAYNWGFFYGFYHGAGLPSP